MLVPTAAHGWNGDLSRIFQHWDVCIPIFQRCRISVIVVPENDWLVVGLSLDSKVSGARVIVPKEAIGRKSSFVYTLFDGLRPSAPLSIWMKAQVYWAGTFLGDYKRFTLTFSHRQCLPGQRFPDLLSEHIVDVFKFIRGRCRKSAFRSVQSWIVRFQFGADNQMESSSSAAGWMNFSHISEVRAMATDFYAVR